MGIHRNQRGLTLVELMIAMAIGVLLLLGVSLLFTQNRQSYRQNEELARIQENARFAIEELSRDLSMAGFFAEIVNGGAVVVHAALPANAADCGPGAAWLYDFTGGLLDGAVRVDDQVAGGADAASQFGCIDAGAAVRPGTDVIGVRRTGGVPSFWASLPAGSVAPNCELTLPSGAACQRPVPARGVFVRENSTSVVIYHGTAALDASDPQLSIIPVPYEDWEYSPRVYYVRDVVEPDGDTVPTLCRQRLNNAAAGNTAFAEECIVPGVEDLQIELGIDTNGDGAANAYVSNPSADDTRRAVSVRLYLLMRAIDVDVGYTDERTYTLGNAPAYSPNDRFHRRVYTTTVAMRNLANIRQLGF
jgi:prepilin-type N-terminal cleavage/methylation domain-containing protein